MAERREGADLFAYMNAYAVLEVEYSATASDIRRAYRRLAQRAHPDRQPQNSPDQARATERMAAINEAYQLVRDAPLRHHPASHRLDPDIVWSDAELENALRRARKERWAFDVLGMALAGAVSGLLSLGLVNSLGYLSVPGFHIYAFVIPVVLGLTGAVLGVRRFFDVWYLIDTLLTISRLASMR